MPHPKLLQIIAQYRDEKKSRVKSSVGIHSKLKQTKQMNGNAIFGTMATQRGNVHIKIFFQTIRNHIQNT